MIFAEALYTNNIPYEYEVIVSLVENNFGFLRKSVDFIVNDVLIEITAIAYESWEQEFISKIEVLKKSTDKKILILTLPEKIDLLKHLEDPNTSIKNYFEVLSNINILVK